jgi:hypothetical protein
MYEVIQESMILNLSLSFGLLKSVSNHCKSLMLANYRTIINTEQRAACGGILGQ